MLRYAPNVSWLFPELSFALRPKAVADLGFVALEFGFPSHADIPSLESARRSLGLEVVLFNQDVPVWDPNNRGYLVDPMRRDEFKRRLDEALDVVRRLQVRKVMLASGVEVPDLSRHTQLDCMVENLRYAAPLAAEADVMLTIEVLNPIDNPGYFLTSPPEAADVVMSVDHPNVRLQLDSYHLAVLGYDPADTVRRFGSIVGHLQFADHPGRHEPGTGTIDFEALGQAAKDVGYRGFIGLEYVPLAQGAQALAWARNDRGFLSS